MQYISLLSKSIPKNITIVEFEQNAVLPELCLFGAVHILGGQVLIHLFQALEALGHVLIINLGIKGHHRLLTQMVGTVDVEASAFLY